MNLHMSDEASNLQDLDAAEFCRPRRDCNQEHASPREIALALGFRAALGKTAALHRSNIARIRRAFVIRLVAQMAGQKRLGGAWIKQTCDAWRTPSRDAAEPDLGSRPEEVMRMRRHLRTEPDDDAQARRDAAWAQYRDQLGNAWKIDPRAATAIERRGEQWRGGR